MYIVMPAKVSLHRTSDIGSEYMCVCCVCASERGHMTATMLEMYIPKNFWNWGQWRSQGRVVARAQVGHGCMHYRAKLFSKRIFIISVWSTLF